MISRLEFERFCAALPATTHVVQWGGASVFKVGGKIFAIYSNWDSADLDTISFKASAESFAVMPGQPGISPAKYLARAQWLSIIDEAGFDADTVELYLKNAHALIVAKLSGNLRRELGLG